MIGAHGKYRRAHNAMGRLARCVALPMALLAVLGCGHGNRAPAALSSEDRGTARARVEAGPLSVEAELRPTKASLADTLELVIVARSESGIRLTAPATGPAVGEFDVLSVNPSLPTIEDGKDVARWAFELEPQKVGKLAAGPFALRFTDARPQGDGKEHVVNVEPLYAEIAAGIDPAKASLEGPAKLGAPLPIEPPGLSPWALGGILALCGGLFAAAFFAVRRRRSEAQPAPVPEDLAALEFAALEKAGWMDVDPKRFYVELTGIVRRYIERTTNIHAPEQTTEEFLRECERNPAIAWTRRDRLRDFLESADLVKFAAVQPLRPAMVESLRTGRRLVDLELAERTNAAAAPRDAAA